MHDPFGDAPPEGPDFIERREQEGHLRTSSQLRTIPVCRRVDEKCPDAPALAQRLKRLEQALVNVVKTAVGKDRD
jgi:hypothetical protein